MKLPRIAAATLALALTGVGLSAAPAGADPGHHHKAKPHVTTTVTHVNDTMPIEAGEACSFAVVFKLDAKVTTVTHKRRVITTYEGSQTAASVTNPANGKTFVFGGKGVFTDHFNKARTASNSKARGVQLFWGEMTMPHSRHHVTTMIYVKGKSKYKLHDVKRADGGWTQFQQIKGTKIDLCRRLA
jgi:hypothetical protein